MMHSASDSTFPAPPAFTMLSVVMPFYRLGAAAGENIATVARLMESRGVPFEIVAVDDGSGDGTAESILQAARAHGCIHPVILAENGGKGAALVAGFGASRGSHVLLLDGDLDLDPAMTWRFFETMRDRGADIVIGSKMHPESQIDYPWRRRLASRVYYSIVRCLLGLPVRDTQTGMKLFSRDALDFAFSRMVTKRYAFDLEVLAIARDAGYRVAEAPIKLDYRGKAGALTLRNVRDVLVDTAAIFWRARLLGYYKAAEPKKMPENPPSVTAVIACPAASAMLEQCIAALGEQRAANPQIRLDAIVLPDEKSGRVWPPWVREIATGKVLPSEKRNTGVREAGGDIIAFLDDDARPQGDWLACAVPWFTDPQVGAVGGPAVTPPEDPFAAQMSGRVYASAVVSGGARRRYVPTAVRDEDDIPSCNLLVRRSVLFDVGLFSSSHWPGEDTFLCRDIVYGRKLRLVYDPRIVAAHHRRPLFGPHLRQVARYARHRGYFARRFPENSRRVAYFVPSMLVAWSVATLACAPLDARLFRAGAAPLALYLALVAAFSFSLRPKVWLWTAAGTIATHFAYGVNFVRGFAAKTMPDGVKDFDHRGEAVAR